MATIVSSRQPARHCAPGSAFIRRLDALGPVLLLAAVLAVLAAAGYESRAGTAPMPLSLAQMHAE